MTTDLTSVARLRDVQTRSISAENPTGAPGNGGRATTGTGAEAATDLGTGWKVSPFVNVKAGETYEFANIEGAGKITHIWIAVRHDQWRSLILRAYWDGDTEPAIEVPLGDFFCQGSKTFTQVDSIPIAANTHGALNSYWAMPFQKQARLTIENVNRIEGETLFFYQVSYELGGDIEGLGYLHAQWRRSNPTEHATTHVLIDGVEGHGQYVGTFVSWAPKTNGWWGEGEIKFYLDDDEEFPTICGTGTEDYFGGAWCFFIDGKYVEYSGPYLGLPQALVPDTGKDFDSQQRFAMYRWHLPDPIHFARRLGKVEIQALGWRTSQPERYLSLRDDIASTSFLYLDRTSTRRPPAPTYDAMEIV